MSFEDNGYDRWEVYDGTSSEVAMQDFLYGLVRMLRPELVVETGACFGYATRSLALGCAVNGKGRVVSFEIDPLRVPVANARIAGLPAIIEPRTCVGARELSEADLIFSDSEYELRPKEYEAAKSGATVVIHDTRVHEPLGDFVKQMGGLLFSAGRGFGVLTKS